MIPGKIIDVLIVGGGPTGMALAMDLARRGLDVRIVDKAPRAFEGSRAKGLQPRTLEVLDDLGAVEDVLGEGGPYPLLGIHLGPLTIPWRMLPRREPTADVPFPNTWLIPQSRTDGAMHARLRRLGRAVAFGTKLVGLTQSPLTVTATVEGTKGTEAITARYLVGADGGASAVRRHLGIAFVGSTDEADCILIVDAVTRGLSRDRWHVWPRRRGRFISACPLPHGDSFQWMIRLAPGDEPSLDEKSVNSRVQSCIQDERVELLGIGWSSVFRPNVRLAERYREGRILLAGDAAHVHTPAGAQGLNTGIQDAYNLGWKLGQVLAGADARLLDTYEAERLPIAAAVLGLSTNKYEAIGRLSPSSIRRGKDEQQLALSYHGGPLAPRDRDLTRTLRVGDRAPDADLVNAEGERIRLFDIYRGPHFTALAYGARAAGDLDRLDWPSAGAPLKRVCIDAGRAHGHVLADSKGTFRRVYGPTDDCLMLIRPDGYVGHIATREMLTTTQRAVHAMAPGSPGGSADSAGAAAPT